MPSKGFTKIGAGSFGRMMRQGALELGGAMYPDSNISQAAGFRNFWGSMPGETGWPQAEDVSQCSTLESRLQQAQSREDKGRDDMDKGMDRE
jgi:hypothetical protein